MLLWSIFWSFQREEYSTKIDTKILTTRYLFACHLILTTLASLVSSSPLPLPSFSCLSFSLRPSLIPTRSLSKTWMLSRWADLEQIFLKISCKEPVRVISGGFLQQSLQQHLKLWKFLHRLQAEWKPIQIWPQPAACLLKSWKSTLGKRFGGKPLKTWQILGWIQPLVWSSSAVQPSCSRSRSRCWRHWHQIMSLSSAHQEPLPIKWGLQII